LDPSRRRLVSDAVVALTLVAFVALGLHDLGRSPKVHEDESLIAAPGTLFAQTGVFGSSLDPGTFGAERRLYGFMPLFSMLVGVALRIFGVGLFQARLVTLSFATGTLLLTYVAACRLFTPRHGAAAVLVLTCAPVMSPVAHLRTGIPLFDIARLVRYDVAVGFFGLASLCVLARVLRRDDPPHRLRLFATGALVGLATLSHAYGVFWLAALVLSLAVARGGAALRVALVPFLSGFALVLAPWLVYVGSGWEDYLGQNYFYGPRFAVFDPAFIPRNLRGEIARYGLVVRAAAEHATPWIFVAASAVGVVSLARAASRDAVARAFLAVLAVLVACFALFLQPKNVLYLATLWPLFALTAACGLASVWRAPLRLARPALVLLGLVLLGEGFASARPFFLEADAMTPYAAFTQTLARAIPRGGRIMGMQHWWLGLSREFPDYVTVPLSRALASRTPHPVPFEEAAEALAPRVFLLDPVLRAFLLDNATPSSPFHALATDVRTWVERRGTLLATVEDPTYGPIEVYGISIAGGRISDTARASTSSTETRVRQSRSCRAQTGCMHAPQERSSL
jgi:4-amino-4-deoxy-L-arabinose transferase-like glycosyltransferase